MIGMIEIEERKKNNKMDKNMPNISTPQNWLKFRKLLLGKTKKKETSNLSNHSRRK